MPRKGVIDMVAFVVAFGVMILLIIFGSYFLIDGEVSKNLKADISSGGTTVQGILAANAVSKSEKIKLQSKMHKYYNGGDREEIESHIETKTNDLLNTTYSRYEFGIEGTDIRVENNYPPGIFSFHISTPKGPVKANIMVDEQKGQPYEPVIGGLG